MPAFFFPARSSRHRAACFALYRALLRLVPPIPLPADVATALGPKNPIKYQIRKAFGRNKHDTSPRLVIASLQSGYNFLSVLKAAQDTKSPEYYSILAFLRKNQASVLAFREAAALAPPDPTLPVPGIIPLLTKLPPRPGSNAPRFKPTLRPLPLSQLTGGVRKVPQLVATGGIPLLRVSKPQTPRLSRIIRQKIIKHQKRIDAQELLTQEIMDEAQLEDKWEHLVHQLGVRDARGSGATFVRPVQEAVQDLKSRFAKEHRERVARGEALWRLVMQERNLARREAQERDGGKAPKLAETRTKRPTIRRPSRSRTTKL